MAEKSLYKFPPGLVCIIAIICSCCSDKSASAPFQYENLGFLHPLDAYYMVNDVSAVCFGNSTRFFQQDFFIKNGKLEKSISDFRCIFFQGDTFRISTVCQFDSTGLRDYFLLNGKKMHLQHTRQPSDN